MLGFDEVEGNVSITFYDSEGKITGFLSGPPTVIEDNKKLGSDLWVDGNYSADSHYVSDGVVKNRKEIECVVNGSFLRNLPIPCEIYVNKSIYKINSDEVELVFDQPGVYRIKISSWPYLDREFEIEN